MDFTLREVEKSITSILKISVGEEILDIKVCPFPKKVMEITTYEGFKDFFNQADQHEMASLTDLKVDLGWNNIGLDGAKI